MLMTNSKFSNNLKIIPFGGVGAVTKNLFVYQYGDNILIIDCGVGFPDEPGAEDKLLIPDFSYLLANKEKVRGLIVTHAHFDHYGAVPNLLSKINLPVYASQLTQEFIKAKIVEFGIKEKSVDFKTISHKSGEIGIGPFKVTPFHINHSVPQTLGIFLQTPVGNIFHVTDYKFDWMPVDEEPFDIQKASLLAAKKKPVLLLSDCLGANSPGYTESESTIKQVLENIMIRAPRMVLVTTVSSNISRMKQTIQAAANVGRKISFLGRSIEESSKIARKLGYFSSLKNCFLPFKKIKRLRPDKQCFIVAGSYGQANSALTRISQNKHHQLKIKKRDTVIFSADPAPPQVIVGVNKVIDSLSRAGARVFYYEIQDNLHASGHGAAEDVKMLFSFIKPKYLMPIGGDYRHMSAYALLAQQVGYQEEKVLIVDQGQTVSISSQGQVVVK